MRSDGLAEHASIIAKRREELRRELAKLIGPTSRFVWEIGSGHGHFLTAYASAHPEETCIGIDIAVERVERADRKRVRSQLATLHFIRADAEDFLAAMPTGARFSSVYILFPDPWPKRRHHKHRLMTQEFLSAVAAMSDKGSCLFFRTDHQPYFRVAAAVTGAHTDWELCASEDLPFEEPTVFQKRAARHFTLVATRR